MRLDADARHGAARTPGGRWRRASSPSRRGSSGAMTVTLWFDVGLLGLCFVAGYLLPRRARPEE